MVKAHFGKVPRETSVVKGCGSPSSATKPTYYWSAYNEVYKTLEHLFYASQLLNSHDVVLIMYYTVYLIFWQGLD